VYLECHLERFVDEYGFANVLEALKQVADEKANGEQDYHRASELGNLAGAIAVARDRAPAPRPE
jgi:hypothetical protein